MRREKYGAVLNLENNNECIAHPKVSVITVVYNNVSEIKKTIDSITSQTYKNVEFIVVDGGSDDGTVEIIKNNEDKIYWWCSEQDNGIYDAMNKGVKLATGDFIIFMNAGDTFFNEHSIDNVMSYPAISDYDVIYGDYYVHDAFRHNGYRIAKKIDNLWKEMPTSHQAMVFKRRSVTPIEYDINAGSAADHNLLIRKYLANEQFLMLENIPIANYSGGGVSDKKRFESYLSVYKNSLLLNKSRFLITCHLLLMLVRTCLRSLYIKVIGK
ncbi:glycosyltransferase family 2 protein [Yersinia alsatica]|uniref:glycosyltransferase family 2 protein n=1 Tax=Yersinia alsatica TaxID=2890317 RepID=UPI0011A6BFFB|nr:glycosyltransferase family 2 protein [Yersinia alsatica]